VQRDKKKDVRGVDGKAKDGGNGGNERYENGCKLHGWRVNEGGENNGVGIFLKRENKKLRERETKRGLPLHGTLKACRSSKFNTVPTSRQSYFEHPYLRSQTCTIRISAWSLATAETMSHRRTAQGTLGGYRFPGRVRHCETIL